MCLAASLSRNIHPVLRVRGSTLPHENQHILRTVTGSHWDPVNNVPELWRRKFNSPCRFKSDRGAAKSEIDAVLAPAQTASSTERHSRSLFRRGGVLPITFLPMFPPLLPTTAGLMFRSFVTSFLQTIPSTWASHSLSRGLSK